jgi:serine/threonine protein kinase
MQIHTTFNMYLNMLQLSNFETEVSMLSTLRPHGNVAGEFIIISFVADTESVFIGICVSPQCIVLEYVGGGSIEKRYRKTALSLEQILSMTRDTAAGMAHLVFCHFGKSSIDLIQHAEGIVHRDLACRNLLLTKHDEVKIVKVSQPQRGNSSIIFNFI